MELSRIGSLIRHRRKECNLSQAALADRMGIGDKKTISEWENGKYPKLENVIALSKALGCEPEYLLGCVEHPSVTTSWIAEEIPLSGEAIDALRGLKIECDKRKDDNALNDEALMTQYLIDGIVQYLVVDQFGGGANDTLMTLAFGLVRALKILAEYPDGVPLVDDDFLFGKENNPLEDEMRFNPPERYRMALWEKEMCEKNLGELIASRISALVRMSLKEGDEDGEK